VIEQSSDRAEPPDPARSPDERHPLCRLSGEDLSLVTEFVLASGSLKALAKRYGVSYPTIRGRVDKVIERLHRLVEGRPRDPLREMLADLVERGRISVDEARHIRRLAAERDADPGESR